MVLPGSRIMKLCGERLMYKNAPALNLRMTVYCALFTAFIIVGGFISIPIPVSPVPIVLSDFFVMVTGLFLGFKYGVISTTLYLALGAIGLPVFAGGTAGLAILFGPRGGYLFGFLLMVACIGLITAKKKPTMITHLIALVVGNIILYLIGVPWLKMIMNLSWAAAIAAGLAPFIIGTVIKIAVAITLGRVLLPKFRQTMTSISAQQTDVDEEE